MKKPERAPTFEEIVNESKEEAVNLVLRYLDNDKKTEDLRQIVRNFNDTEYLHWDDVRRRKWPYDPKLIWMIFQRERLFKYHKIRIGSEEFRFIIPGAFAKQLHRIDKASPASFDWLFGEGPSEANKKQYLINSLMEEAIASSQLEGAATTRPEAKKILREGRKPKNTSERMIVNNYRTIRRLKELRDQPLSCELILEIHREITKGTLASEAEETEFRICDDIVVSDKADPTKVYHYPPKCEKIPAMIDDLIVFANSEDEFIHPIVKAIIIHFLIGYIHPFNDGNGRTARAIFYWYALKHHYDLLEYISISRIFVHAPAQYARAYLLTETDSNDMTYFIDFNIRIISQALDNLKQYIIRKRVEESESLQLVEQIPNLSFRQAEILRNFIMHPTRVYTISEIAGKYKVSLPTARSDLLLLEEKGKLKKYQDGKRLVFMYKGATAKN
jgi:Fic family protein